MNLLEYEAKELLAASSITVPRSTLYGSSDSVTEPSFNVLKSQVPTGNRGKLGGIIIIDKAEDFTHSIKKLLSHPIKGLLPTHILVEEKLSIKKELYLSLSIDRVSMSLKLLAHTDGGVDVEDNSHFKSWIIDYDELHADTVGQELADYYNLPEQTFALQDLIEKLYSCFTQNDATLIEINPLVLTADDQVIAGDCKMTLDDAAAFRHNWHFEAPLAEANFVTIDPTGNVATIANGAGLAMATVDAAFEAGLKPANFLDIGGGATAETLLKAFERIVEYPNVQAVVINIFAGITQSDEVARAIVAANQQIPHLPPLFIRIAGTNYEEATEILKAEHILLIPDLATCLKAARRAVHD